MKYQVLFSLKNNEKVFMDVVCCSRDWRFKNPDWTVGALLILSAMLGNSYMIFRLHCS